MCVAQTAITARERRMQVTVLADACATIDPANEHVALEYLEHVTGSVILAVEDWVVERSAARARARSTRPCG